MKATAPKARNVIAWGNAPGTMKPFEHRALKTRHGTVIPPLQGFEYLIAGTQGCRPGLLHCAPLALWRID